MKRALLTVAIAQILFAPAALASDPLPQRLIDAQQAAQALGTTVGTLTGCGQSDSWKADFIEFVNGNFSETEALSIGMWYDRGTQAAGSASESACSYRTVSERKSALEESFQNFKETYSKPE